MTQAGEVVRARPRGVVRVLGGLGLFALTLVGVAVGLLAYGYSEATRDVAIVRYTVTAPQWTRPPLSIALISDTHAVLPDMPVRRLNRMCDTATALRPDVILLAGDYVSRRTVRTAPVLPWEAARPFARCRARLGTYAVLGNHDMRWPGLAGEVATGLARASVTVLRNRAVRVDDPAGAFWIAGVDDWDFGKAKVDRALAHVPPGAPTLFLVHSPDVFAEVPPRVALTLAGHTHGGQVAPFGWRPVLPIVHCAWARGFVRDHFTQMVVTSGVGASGLPVRIGVPPEIALIDVHGGAAVPVPASVPAPGEGCSGSSIRLLGRIDGAVRRAASDAMD